MVKSYRHMRKTHYSKRKRHNRTKNRRKRGGGPTAPDKPSLYFVKTGELLENEKYNQELHNAGLTLKDRNYDYERQAKYYTESELAE